MSILLCLRSALLRVEGNTIYGRHYFFILSNPVAGILHRPNTLEEIGLTASERFTMDYTVLFVLILLKVVRLSECQFIQAKSCENSGNMANVANDLTIKIKQLFVEFERKQTQFETRLNSIGKFICFSNEESVLLIIMNFL